ncbi:hypothetical protein HZS_7238 [Henneguya salminicola]|nr:hypothetical protein HZS_7238 [Henneguya salminicola]
MAINIAYSPSARSGHCSAIMDNMILIYGGYTNIKNTLFPDISFYHIFKKDWIKYKKDINADDCCASSSFIVHDHFVFLFGGTCYPFGRTISNTLSMFDFTTKRWEVLSAKNNEPSINQPQPLYGSLMFYYGESVYIYGGSYALDFSNSMHKFCLSTRKWSLVRHQGNIPLPSYRVAGTIVGHRLLIFGGSSVQLSERFRNYWAFDLITKIWSKHSTSPVKFYPISRIFESFTFTSTHGYMSGGESESKECLNDIWSIDLSTFTWRQLNYILDHGVKFHSSVVYDNTTLYVFGGSSENGKRNCNLQKFHIYGPSLLTHCLTLVCSDKRQYEELIEEIPLSIYNKIQDHR